MDARLLSTWNSRKGISRRGCPASPWAQAGSGVCVGPVAALVKIDDRIILLDRPRGGARRRTLGAVAQLQVPEDLLDNRGVADQADDPKWSGAAWTEQGIGLVYLRDQPGPGAPAVAYGLFGAAGMILGRRQRFGGRSR